MSVTYRPEIDGLRAVAVLSVLVYHAGFTVSDTLLLSGGFLGVDIFFVISGYLITKIILEDLEVGKFSIAKFYDRRARRILPALLVVMTAALVVGWYWLTPKAMTEFAGSAVASLLFTSNVWFLLEDSYWAEPSALKPLLHTWSLAVEEQFYLFFPLLLMAIWRFARDRILLVFLVLFVASLGLAEWASRAMPEANFYLLPFRGWELLLGSILVVLEPRSKRLRLGRGIYRLATAFGLIAILGSMVLFDSDTRHPSIATLVPVLGTGAIILFARKEDHVIGLLSFRPFVWVGLISYSLYLWHFPILAFAQIRETELSDLQRLGLLGLSAVLAIITYFAIEQPARNRGVVRLSMLFPTIGGASVLLAASFLFLIVQDGYPARLGEASRLFAYLGNSEIDSSSIQVPDCETATETDECAQKPTERNIYLVGDSHAGVLNRAVTRFAEKYDRHYVRRNLGSCPHVDVHHIVFGECDTFRAETFEILDEIPPSIIFYALHWRKYQDQTGTGKYKGTVRPHPGETLHAAYARLFKSWQDAGHIVIVVYPGVESEDHLRRRVTALVDAQPAENQAVFLDTLMLTVPYNTQVQRAAAERQLLDSLPSSESFIKIDPLTLFCVEDKNVCELNRGDKLILADQTHYTGYAADMILSRAENRLLEIDGALYASD
ncbi:MAG: acyltransferase family protein [Pseudomonadota bacterium]